MRTDRDRGVARFVAAGMVLCLACACVDQSPFAPTANALIVHAVLDAGTRDQYVIVESSTGATLKQQLVSGAHVTITTPDGRSLVADEVPDTTFFPVPFGQQHAATVYRISLDRYDVTLQPGGTYHLAITVPDGRRVTGSTTIPTAIPVSSTALSSQILDRLHDTLSLAWAPVPGASAYEVLVTSSLGTFNVFADTTITLPGTVQGPVGDQVFSSGSTHRLVVSAVDANYYDYYRRNSDEFTGSGLIGHLHGALGVFGSIVELRALTIAVK